MSNILYSEKKTLPTLIISRLHIMAGFFLATGPYHCLVDHGLGPSPRRLDSPATTGLSDYQKLQPFDLKTRQSGLRSVPQQPINCPWRRKS